MGHLVLLFSGIVVGIIIMQTAITAPLIFKTLTEEQAGPFLRSIFPRFFAAIALLSFIAAIIAFQAGIDDTPYMMGSSFILAIVAHRLIPATNKARDEGNDNHFKLLHTVSVVLTLLILFLNLSNFF